MSESIDGLQCLVECTHVTHISIPLCPLGKSCPPIILHGPQLSLECTAASLVCSLGSLIIRFCKQMIVAGASLFEQLWVSLSASSNQSWCFFFDRPTTSAVVSCSMVFICFHCSSGSQLSHDEVFPSNMTSRLFITLGSRSLCTCSFFVWIPFL